MRFDFLFRKRSKSSPNGQGEVIAVIKYKRRRLIRYNDFQPALVAEGAPPEKKDILEGNAGPFCKQVSVYATRTGCGHVALLDCDNLTLFEFHRLGRGRGGDEAKVSWVHESDEGLGFIEEGYIRKVLLGWLVKAFEDAGMEVKS